ncbi:bidirectional sugar transporter SWEET1-like isoform X2 [Prosopis cineraria]|uniref:bidirectional sugar transporter SWEET1-like isoform X2 n=1 Tax=Prosopis cineraria TaxID=364024 RepID=UPI00240F8B66|nr:bidirectional sugar transporter SWEET1-like isoform X2 [Prosopis cineraria]
MENVAHFLFGIFGNVFAMFLFLSPAITFFRIIKNRSTEKFSGIPYVMTLLNCLLSAWYGLPFVSPNNLLVSTINGAGAGTEIVYVLIFITLAPKKEKVKIIGLFSAVLIVFLVVVVVSLFALRDYPRKLLCGLLASIFSVVMYSSPFSIMVPNGVGSALGAMQLTLYSVYRENRGTPKTEEEALEMGEANQNVPTKEAI